MTHDRMIESGRVNPEAVTRYRDYAYRVPKEGIEGLGIPDAENGLRYPMPEELVYRINYEIWERVTDDSTIWYYVKILPPPIQSHLKPLYRVPRFAYNGVMPDEKQKSAVCYEVLKDVLGSTLNESE